MTRIDIMPTQGGAELVLNIDGVTSAFALNAEEAHLFAMKADLAARGLSMAVSGAALIDSFNRKER